MKMRKSLFLLAAAPFVISCGYEIPETVSVKTNAEYNFIVGERRQSLSEYLSVKTIADSMNSADGEFSFDVYDYYPAADRRSAENDGYPSQKFLADCTLYEIPVDIGEYLDKMDFSESLKGMSFEQTFDVPSLAVDSYKEPLELPDLNEEIRTSADLAFNPIEIPHGINGSIPEESCPSQKINVRSPEFETLAFYSGFLELTLECQNVPIDKTDLTVYLNTADGTTITSTSGVNLSEKHTTVRLPLAGKTLPKNMSMKVSGTSQDSGSPDSSSIYTVSARISDDAKISRATGLSMKIDPVAINQKVIIGTDDAFVECEIGDKSADEKSVLSIETKLPDGWSGITAASKEIRLEGALTAENTEFDTAGETGIYLLNRKLYLNGKTYKKGDIQVVGNLEIELINATVEMPDGEIPSIEISTTTCDITKVNSMTVDLGKYKPSVQTKVEKNEPLPSEVTDVIEKMELLPSGMKVAYFNTLPEGNDITFTVNSSFFGIADSADDMKSGTSKEHPGTMEFLGVEKTVKITETSKIDFTAEMKFPGATAGNSYVTLTDIEVGKSYTVSAKVTPVFDWESVTLKTDATAVNGDVDTGLNVSEIFSSLTEKLGDDSFIDRIALTSIPLYVYAVVPSAAEDFEFTGTMKAVAYDENDRPIEDNAVAIAEDKINSEFTPLQFDAEDKDKQQVIGFGESGESSVKMSADIAELFNSRNAKNIKIEYNFTLGSKNQGEAGSTVEILKKDLDELEGTDSVSIRLHARLILPLELEILPDEESSDPAKPVKIDVMNLIDRDSDDSSDDDLFGRDEATDIDDIKKYIDAIEYAGIRYKMDNKVLRYTELEKDVKLVLDMKDGNGSPVYSNEISLAVSSDAWKLFKIETEKVEQLLETYPVRSDISVELPVGELIIPRETEIALNLALSVKTDGTIELFSR